MRTTFALLATVVCLFPGTSQAAPIHDAAEKGDIAALTALLDQGANVNEADNVATPLYYAVSEGHLEAAKLLIARGADVNRAAKFGPPLMAAAQSGKPELVRLLLDAGADATLVFRQQTALEIVAENGCLDCAVALVERGADVNGLNALRQPPLHFAMRKGNKAVAAFLLSHGYQWPTPPPVTPRLATADTAKGEALFKRKCGPCHFSAAVSPKSSGPNLWEVVGRVRGSLSGFRYSAALRDVGGTWTYENLNIFISDPSRAIPGIYMTFEGIQDDAQRADIIAFLRTRSANPVPLP